MSILLALSSALTYGFADFSGGLASRRAAPLAVTGSAQAVGLVLTPLLLLVFPAAFDATGLGVGMVAGVFGGIGLALYFTALRDGAMGVVSPLSAVAAAGVPIAVGVLGGEEPSTLALLGIALALPAIYLAARTSDPATAILTEVERRRGLPPGLALGLASGLAFGVFFALLDLAPDDSGAWPLLGSKLGSLGVVAAVALLGRRPLVAPRAVALLVVCSGALDMTANMLFLLATRGGLLSLVSVIAAQYPVVVVILSVLLLGERMGRSQRSGVVLALLAVAMISLG